MNRSALYLIVGILIAGGVTMGFQLYNERQKTDRVEIDAGESKLGQERR